MFSFCRSLVVILFAAILFPIVNIGFNPRNLKGRKVIVTGASQGIGEEIALFHCSQGSEVVILARNLSRMERVVTKCIEKGASGAYYLKVDFDTVAHDYLEKVVTDSVNLLGNSLDAIYLNHIGGSSFIPEGYYGLMDLEFSTSMLKINFLSYMGLAHFATPFLEKTKGRIVVVGSVAGRSGVGSAAIYSATKHAVFGYFESLRIDYAKYKSNVSITTSTIGTIDTENARRNTKGSLPDYIWHDPADCGRAIVVGAELRRRDVFFPIMQTYPSFLLRIFPQVLDYVSIYLV